MDRVTVKLKYPITTGSQTIDEVHVRRPTAGDLRGAPANEMDRALHVMGKVTGLTSDQVDKLDMKDMEQISKVQEGFQ
jgi:hypothetical protein